MKSPRSLPRPIAVTVASSLILAACSTAGAGIADWPDAQQRIMGYYDDNALEADGDCPGAMMPGIGKTRFIRDTASEVVVQVDYFWGIDGGGRAGTGGDCLGNGQRTFVLSPDTEGPGHGATSMSGAVRGG